VHRGSRCRDAEYRHDRLLAHDWQTDHRLAVLQRRRYCVPVHEIEPNPPSRPRRFCNRRAITPRNKNAATEQAAKDGAVFQEHLHHGVVTEDRRG
jgi:hypothetical protein